MNVSRYAKFIAALVGLAGVIGTVAADGVVTTAEVGTLAASVVGAILVFAVPNKPTV